MSLDPALWHKLKVMLAQATGWPMDTLHVIGGVLLQLLVARLLRRSLANAWPWLAVLFLQLGNEAYDLWLERWPSLAIQLGESLRDVIGTMLLPTVLLLVARSRPRLLTGPR